MGAEVRIELSFPKTGHSMNLSDLELQGTGRYPTAIFEITGLVKNLEENKVYLVVNPTFPTGGGIWIQHPSAQVDRDGEFTASAQYGVDQEWSEAKYEFEVSAIAVPAESNMPRDRIQNLGTIKVLAQSNRTKISLLR